MSHRDREVRPYSSGSLVPADRALVRGQFCLSSDGPIRKLLARFGNDRKPQEAR